MPARRTDLAAAPVLPAITEVAVTDAMEAAAIWPAPLNDARANDRTDALDVALSGKEAAAAAHDPALALADGETKPATRPDARDFIRTEAWATATPPGIWVGAYRPGGATPGII